jgi:hypothetical protein
VPHAKVMTADAATRAVSLAGRLGLTSRNPLRFYFRHNHGRLIHKWTHYFDIYHRHLEPYRGRSVTLVEFGIYHGGSLEMWKWYLGRRARIIGVDNDPRCKKLAGKQVEVVIGDQEDHEFLCNLRSEIGPVDIVIDDGGHTMAQQLATFEEMWPAVRDGGVFLVEDVHTSYWPNYGGGYKRSGTFIEYAKALIDQQHAWHAGEGQGPLIDYFTCSIRGMHFYDSVVVVDKAVVSQPRVEMRGVPSFPA